jgi:hypothetical protein
LPLIQTGPGEPPENRFQVIPGGRAGFNFRGFGLDCPSTGHGPGGLETMKKNNGRRRRKARAKRRKAYSEALLTTHAAPAKRVATRVEVPKSGVPGGKSAASTLLKETFSLPTFREWGLIVTGALALINFLKDPIEMLGVVDRLVNGWRAIYSSVWRTLWSYLPASLRLFDAPQTYDALTFISIMAFSLWGTRQISQRGRVADLLASGLLSFILQIFTIRLFDRTPYDVVATTTVNLAIIGISLGLVVALMTVPALKTKRWLVWSPLTVGFATVLCMLQDDPGLLFQTVTGTLQPDLGIDPDAMRRVAGTAILLTNLGAAVLLGYTFHGPRRPLFAYTLGIAMIILTIAFVGGILERALYDAGMAPDSGIEPAGATR